MLDDGGVSVSPDTMFLTASISKTIVAMLSVLAHERDELNLDEELMLNGKPLQNPCQQGMAITARLLLKHESGLCDDESALLPGPFRVPERDHPIKLAEYVASRLVPGGSAFDASIWGTSNDYHYSNAGITMLAAVLEERIGVSLEKQAKARIFDRLGMTHSSFTLVIYFPSVCVSIRASTSKYFHRREQ